MTRRWSAEDDAWSRQAVAELRAAGARVGHGVQIGRGADLARVDDLEIGDRTFVGPDVTIAAPRVRLGENCVVYSGVSAVCGDELVVGRRAKISRGTAVRARRVRVGDELWCNAEVDIGGGGWQGPRATLEVGDAQVLGKQAMINVCEPVRLAGRGAVSIQAAIFTHGGGHGQSWLEGFHWTQAPVTVGERSTVLVRAVVLPGVTLGAGASAAAGAVVTRDVPDGQLVAGVPARPLRPAARPLSDGERQDRIRDLLAHVAGPGQACAGGTERYGTEGGDVLYRYVLDAVPPELARARGAVAVVGYHVEAAVAAQAAGDAGEGRPVAVFDLGRSTVSGQRSGPSEDLRHEFRRRGVWLDFAGGYRPPPLDWRALVEGGVEQL